MSVFQSSDELESKCNGWCIIANAAFTAARGDRLQDNDRRGYRKARRAFAVAKNVALAPAFTRHRSPSCRSCSP